LALRAHWDTDALPAALQSALEAALPALEPAAVRADAFELLAYLRFESGFVPRLVRMPKRACWPPGPILPAAPAHWPAAPGSIWRPIATTSTTATQLQTLQAWLDEAQQLAVAAGTPKPRPAHLHQLAVLASHHHQDWVGAEALLAESQALWQGLGDRRKVNARLRNRAQCWLHLGRVDAARASFEQCEQMAREDGDWVGQIDSQLSLASLLGNQRNGPPQPRSAGAAWRCAGNAGTATAWATRCGTCRASWPGCTNPNRPCA
jgi:hypothetical protein